MWYRGFDINSQLDQGTLLHIFSKVGDIEALKCLLSIDEVYVDIRDGDNRTALQVASIYGETEAVQILLEHSANPNLLYPDGAPQILVALKHENMPIAKALIAGTDAATLDMQINGISAIEYAVYHDADPELVKDILNKYCELSSPATECSGDIADAVFALGISPCLPCAV